MKAATRRFVRMAALEALYEAANSNHDAFDALERRLIALGEDEPDLREPRARRLARGMVEGVLATREQADALIAGAAPRYPLETMALVDRNILRLAIWELLTDASAPVAAVVNEAVELAHMYSGGSSPSFINGVLRTISQTIEGSRPGNEGSSGPVQSPPAEE